MKTRAVKTSPDSMRMEVICAPLFSTPEALSSQRPLNTGIPDSRMSSSNSVSATCGSKTQMASESAR